MAAESWKHLHEKNNFCQPVTLAWFSIQILIISKFSKLSWNISLQGSNLLLFLSRQFLPYKCMRERFNDGLKILEFTRICRKNQSKRDWVAKFVFLIQMLLTFGGHCNRCFWDIRLKMLRLPNFKMLFQLVLTKFFMSELFSCLLKVDHVITVMQRAYY